jgi:peptidyl-prolyl cis-trans isomerase D
MQKHRKYLVVTIWISTIAFVGAGFVGWGAYSYNQDKANSVATVGSSEITVKELQTAYNNIYNYYNQMLGGQLTKEKAQELHLQDIALNQLIQEALLINYAKEHGIIALKEEVLAKIQSIDAFQKNGMFDKAQYFQVLKSIGTDAKSFEKGIEKEIVIEKLNKLLDLPAAEVEAKMLYGASFIEDKLALKTVTVNPDDIKIEDEELKKFWEANREKYLSPKRYILEAITIKAASIDVDDAALQAYYDEHKTRFKDKEDKILPFEKAKEDVRKAVQMKKAKTEALKKYLALKNGKISPEQNLTLEEGKSEIPLDKIRTAKSGSYIKTIPLKNGYMTAKLVRVELPKPLPFEAAKEQALAQLKAKKLQQLLQERAKAALKESKDFKEIGYVSREDASKIDMLKPIEASELLNHIFGSTEKSGYYTFSDKAVVYRIEDQKLFDADKFAKKREELTQSAKGLKKNTMQGSLIEQLQKKYKIEKHIKG